MIYSVQQIWYIVLKRIIETTSKACCIWVLFLKKEIKKFENLSFLLLITIIIAKWPCYNKIPIRSTFANAFLHHYKKQWLSNWPPGFQPQTSRQYVNIFATFTSHVQLKRFVNYMNKQHPDTNFTLEVEHNNAFSLFNIKICRENKKFTTSVHRKGTFSGLFANFTSFMAVIHIQSS